MPRSLEVSLETGSTAQALLIDDAALERSIRRHRFVRKSLRLSAEIVTLGLLLALFCVRFPQVEGRSMQPNIQQDNHVLINTLAYEIRLGAVALGRRPVRRGDVVAFARQGASGENRVFLKRVIGLAGDTVRIDRGTILVNGVLLREAYQTIADDRSYPAVTVPPNGVFVLGDNRADSDDSRSFGPVNTVSIIGKACFVIWPLGHARPID